MGKVDPLFITNIEAPIKGGVMVELGLHTLLWGKSRGGKTEVIQAVEYLVDGKVSDIAGRASLADEKLLKEALLDADDVDDLTLWATGKLSDGTTQDRKTGEKKKATTSQVLFMSRVREELAGGPERASRFLLPRLVTVGEADVLARLPDDTLKEVYKTLASALPKELVQAEVMLQVREDVRKRAHALAVEHAAKTDLAKGLATNAVYVSDAEHKAQTEASQAASAALAWEKAKVTPPTTGPSLANWTAQAQALAANEAQYQMALAQCEALAAIPEETVPNGGAVVMLGTIARLHAEKGLDTCALCDSTVGVMKFRQKDQDLKEIAASQMAIQSRQVIRSTALQQKTFAEAQLAQIRIRADELMTLKPIPQVEAPIADLSVLQLNATTQAAKLEEMAKTRARQVAHAEASAQAHKVGLQAQVFESLIAHLDGAIGDFVSAAIERFILHVQKYMPEEWPEKFSCRLSPNFRFGLVKPGATKLRDALSGAERVAVLTAMCVALVEMSGGVGSLFVLIPEERLIDADSLREIMKALAKAPCQIILTATDKPTHGKVAGWTLVERKKSAVVIAPLPGVTPDIPPIEQKDAPPPALLPGTPTAFNLFAT